MQNMRPVNNRSTLLKVVILGDGGVGKSCLMNRFVSNNFDEHSFHTIGVEFLNKDIEIDNEVYTLQIWDTAGQERFKTLRTPFYRGSDICMLTYAIDDRTSFVNLQMWMNEFLYYADVKENCKFPFIVVGNKSDVSPREREVSQTEMERWCDENQIVARLEASAKSSENVQKAFRKAVAQWISMEAKADKNANCNYLDGDETRVDLTKKQSLGGGNQGNRNSCCVGANDEQL